MKKFIGLGIIIILGIGVFVGCGGKDISLTSSQSKNLQISNNKLDYSAIKKDGDNYNIELTYHDQLTAGNVNHIKTVIKNAFGINNAKIDLIVQQFKPMNEFNYIYKDGSWENKI